MGTQTNTVNPRWSAPDWVFAWGRERNNQKTSATNREWLDALGPRPDYLGPSLGVSDDIEAAARIPWSQKEQDRLESALGALAADCTYSEWLTTGMALHELSWRVVVGSGGIEEDRGLELWDAWSATCPDMYPGRAMIERKWLSFKRPYSGSKVTVASIYRRARECGWTEDFPLPPQASPPDHTSEAGEEVHQTQGPHDHGSEQEQKNGTNHQKQESRTGREEDAGAQSRKKVNATPFEAFDLTKIPPRQWLYDRHYVRKYVTATVAPGGSAKTALKLAEVISMAIGRDLLNSDNQIDRQRVWYWNGEDPLDEIKRRIAAICLRYNVDPKELEGWLFVDSGHDAPICLATEYRGLVTFDRAAIDAINETLRQNKIDVLVLDPFISIHRVSENNNPLIDQVIKLLGKVANQNNCGIEIVHHVRKPSMGQHEITADDTRGGGAIVNAVRSCQVLNRMSSKDAEQARIEQDERFRYFRADSGKQNLAPPAKAKWRFLESIDLPNGDNVQVVESWKFPEIVNSVTQEEMEFIRATAQAGVYNRWNAQAKYWIGHPLADRLGLDPKNKADRQDIWAKLNACRRNRMIALETRLDANRRPREFVVPGPGGDPGGEHGGQTV